MVPQSTSFRKLYYFTAEKHAYTNIRDKEIKVSTFDALNDSHEFKNIDTSGREQRPLRRKIDNLVKEEGKSKGLICFSRSWRSPLMWGLYANKGSGVCLGFDVPDYFGQQSLVTDITYSPEKISFEQLASSSDPYAPMDALLHTKFVDWEHEKETRMIVSKSECILRGNFWFRSFGEELILREIFLGDKCSKKIADYEKLIANSGYGSNVKVKRARPAFGSYQYTLHHNSR